MIRSFIAWKGFVLFDGKNFVALDYSHPGYKLTSNVTSAHICDTKKELLAVKREMTTQGFYMCKFKIKNFENKIRVF